MFQSTRPVRGATHINHLLKRASNVSIHAPRAGRDRLIRRMAWAKKKFQSTRPVRGATILSGLTAAQVDVSIHAPRAGRDYANNRNALCHPLFQSTRPVRGATSRGLLGIHALFLFQSTRPVRGATSIDKSKVDEAIRFNPRAPCGARPLDWLVCGRAALVSIHAPRAGRDDQPVK